LKAEKRKAATQFGGGGNISTTVGRTRDTVASKLGIGSGKQYEKEKYIVEKNQGTITPNDFSEWDEGNFILSFPTSWESQ